jgi:hypothetical protein
VRLAYRPISKKGGLSFVREMAGISQSFRKKFPMRLALPKRAPARDATGDNRKHFALAVLSTRIADRACRRAPRAARRAVALT